MVHVPELGAGHEVGCYVGKLYSTFLKIFCGVLTMSCESEAVRGTRIPSCLLQLAFRLLCATQQIDHQDFQLRLVVPHHSLRMSYHRGIWRTGVRLFRSGAHTAAHIFPQSTILYRYEIRQKAYLARLNAL